MKIGIILAIGVAMLALGISGLVVRASAAQAEATLRQEVQLRLAGKDCSKRDFIHEFVTRYDNAKPYSNEERAGYAVGIGLAVLAESMNCGR